MRLLTEYLSTKIKLSKIIATDETIENIVKDELTRLGHDADLNHIDVSEVTNISGIFGCDRRMGALHSEYQDLNPDISRWDVSNVIYMDRVFYDCKNFNCDISEWDVSSCKSMSSMFYFCRKFNCNISKWNVCKLEDMSDMFEYCDLFIQNLSKWNVQNVKNAWFAFSHTPMENKKEFWPKFNQDINI